MSQGGKNCKTGTKFTIRDTQHNGRTQRDSLFYLSQKQDRNTNPDRKGLSILSNEEKHSKSESGLRSTLREKCRSPEQETQLRGDLNHFIRQSLWVLVYVQPGILFLSSFTGPKTLPNVHVHLFDKMDPISPVGACSHLLWIPSLFDPQGAFLRMCRSEVFLELRSGHLISLLQQSSASATSFVPRVSG